VVSNEVSWKGAWEGEKEVEAVRVTERVGVFEILAVALGVVEDERDLVGVRDDVGVCVRVKVEVGVTEMVGVTEGVEDGVRDGVGTLRYWIQETPAVDEAAFTSMHWLLVVKVRT